ncbi:MAG: phosphatase PAP2 family protein [Bacteroidales bacterium]|nr:phosphatase PAP2 family protein [Bacteroidales bacterium]MBQ6687908.1 phosphatase PAP2 family protein [Bacteroidales bacterium]
MIWQNIHHADQLVTLEINSWHSPFTDPIWAFFSDKYVWIPMYAAIICLLIWRLGWKKGLIVLAGALLTFGFCDQFSNLIKNLVCRLRPLEDAFMLENGLHILEWGGGFSFFSAHSANAFGLATSTLTGLREDKRCKYRIYAAWMYFWATMVALSRIFVGRHYLGDVITGSIIGTAAGFAFGILARHVMHKSENKLK